MHRTLIALAAVVALGYVSAATNASAAHRQGADRSNGDVRRPDTQRPDVPWLATPVAVMSPDMAVATALDRFTMGRRTTDRSMTAAPATTLSTADAAAMAFRLSAV